MKLWSNTKPLKHENASENIVCELAAILSRGRWVNVLKLPNPSVSTPSLPAQETMYICHPTDWNRAVDSDHNLPPPMTIIIYLHICMCFVYIYYIRRCKPNRWVCYQLYILWKYIHLQILVINLDTIYSPRTLIFPVDDIDLASMWPAWFAYPYL